MIKIKNMILGGGIAGLASGLRLSEKAEDYLVIEQAATYGGLCSSFTLDNFIFDYFIHLSFTTNNFVRRYFDRTSYYTHIPNPFNYYQGKWIKHPAMNNLYVLSKEEKELVLQGLSGRDSYVDKWNQNYEYWLRYQFGDYFAEHFPLVYTRKYWAEDAYNMETKWIGNRIYQPSLKEILEGMNSENTPVTYYAKEMRYPQKGGYSEYLKPFVNQEHLKLNERVVYIDLRNKVVATDREEYCYNNLYSSIALPEFENLIVNDGSSEYKIFCEHIKQLHWTSGYLVSLGIKGKIPRNDLWDYVYDEDILVSRFYSPSQMSPNTAPADCYSIQAEVYTKDGQPYNRGQYELLDTVISQLNTIGAIDKSGIIVKDIRFRKYCNILFDHNIYVNRNVVLAYLKNNGIIPIGRFGLWKYYWSDQSFMSGYIAV